ncbi:MULTISPECIES: hypothetical protein [Lactococcus]|uniref:Prophage protein n=2 Tax=Lactococcus lactis TaxID=1358 RepID=A0A1V0NG01_LACLL|nr:MULTISPECIES: hypothetical protein [Lactococcus]ARD98871.1 prophage protein [Lactococcus lactis subsp. lactis]NHI69369.1 hypothetical protein [Lactococcus garvieae]NHJ06476.1 hypothetical protein [Lactococcus garvieae]
MKHKDLQETITICTFMDGVQDYQDFDVTDDVDYRLALLTTLNELRRAIDRHSLNGIIYRNSRNMSDEDIDEFLNSSFPKEL